MAIFGDLASMHTVPCDPKKKCSILVPAYEYPEGIRRILDGLCGIDEEEFEIIISDDSTSDRTQNLVEAHQLTKKRNVKYHRNVPGLGAVNNWNFLLATSKSEVLLLLHHDEFLVDPSFMKLGVNQITSGSADVVVGRVKLFKENTKNSVIHFPLFLSSWLINHKPEYIYQRNFIGPVSCILFRRSLGVNFDNNLRWLVDVDFYYRLRCASNKWSFSKKHEVYSVIDRADSITGQIKNKISTIHAIEKKYLLDNRNLKTIQKLYSNPFLSKVETAAWLLFRLVWNSSRRILSYL